MATEIKALNGSTWTQVSAGDAYIENISASVNVYWACSVSAPTFGSDAANVIKPGENNNVNLSQAIWAKTGSGELSIPVTAY